jgi:hypothetical protein
MDRPLLTKKQRRLRRAMTVLAWIVIGSGIAGLGLAIRGLSGVPLYLVALVPVVALLAVIGVGEVLSRTGPPFDRARLSNMLPRRKSNETPDD